MLLQQSEATAARRRIPIHLVDATDGISAETGETGGQPQLSKNGAAFGNTTATLTAVGNGSYYVELTQAELDTLGYGKVRYKSANTAEAQVAFQVVAFDPYDAVRLGATALPNADADAAGGLPISDAGGLDLDAILADTNELQGDWVNGGRLDLIVDQILADTGTDGVAIATATQESIADTLLDRNMGTGTDSGSATVRTVRQALRFLRNKWSISGTTLTVTKEDDSTTSWTGTVTTDAAADPITGNDPASS